MSRAAITNPQPTLQQGSRRLPKFNHQFHSIFVKGVVCRLFTALSSVVRSARFTFLFWSLQEFLLVLRQTLRAPEFNYRGNFFFGDEWSVQTMNPSGPRGQVKHVAPTQQSFRPVSVENRS